MTVIDASVATDWVPDYEHWRHGGWYVLNVHYPEGGIGCVSRNFPDGKWRIVDETSVSDLSTVRTFPNRDAAAHAELVRATEQWETIRQGYHYETARVIADALPLEVLREVRNRAAVDGVVMRVALHDAYIAALS